MTAVRVPWNVSELVDVGITSPARGDRLYYDSVTSTWKNLAADVVSAKVYGSVGDGTVGAASGTNNTTAIAAAVTAAGSGPVFFPTGYHRTTVAASTLSGPFKGDGQVITTESGPAYNARGKFYNNITSQPSTLAFRPVQSTNVPFTGDIATAFNGDLAHVPLVIEHRISGADTLGSAAQAATGYFEVAEASPLLGYMTSSSGRSGAGSSGRTGVGFFHLTLEQKAGAGGDMAGLWVDAVASGVSASGNTTATGVNTVTGTPSNFNVASTSGFPSAGTFYCVVAGVAHAVAYTSIVSSTRFGGCTGSVTTAGGEVVANRWDQNSSVGMWAGAMMGGADGVFLDGDELQYQDKGYDVTAIGMVRNFYRTKDTAPLGQFYNGIRLQSVGDATHGNLDAGIMLYGSTSGYMVGIDMAAANLPTSGTYVSAAMTLKQGHRIYFNADGTTDAGGLGFYRRPNATGSDYIAGTSLSGGRIDTTVGGNNTLQVSSTAVTFNGAGAINGALDMLTHQITGLSPGTLSTHAAALANTIDQFAALPNNTSLTGKLAAGTAVNLLKIGTGGSLLLGDTSAGSLVIPNAHAFQGFNSGASAGYNLAQVTAGNVIQYGDTGASGVNIVTDTTTGLKIATATTQKIGFYNATPVVQPSATTELFSSLNALGLIPSGATPITTSGLVTLTGGLTATTTNLTLTDVNIALSTSTGTRIGTGTTQKLGFFNATPVVQEAGSNDVLASLVTLGLRAASSNPPLNLGTGALTAGATSLGGALNMNTHQVNSVTDGTAAQDAITVSQRVDPLAQAAGYIQWNYSPLNIANTSTLTAGTVYMTAIWLPPGKQINNVVILPTVAASGTAPTNFYVGITGPTGTMLAQSNDVKTTVLSATGPLALPLNAAYTTSSSDSSTGLYYIVVLQVGSWGSTQPSFGRISGSAPVAAGLSGNPRMFATGVTTSRTALPANASGIAGGLTTNSAVGFFFGVS